MQLGGLQLQLVVPYIAKRPRCGILKTRDTFPAERGAVMKIRVEHGPVEENEVVLRCRELDDEMLEVLALLKDRSAKLVARKNGESFMLQPGDVYYADSVDGKTFVCTRDLVLETGRSLSQLEDAHGEAGFLRISKSQLVNLYRVSSLKSLSNSRVELTLQNAEKLIVSRHYIQNLKEKLGMLD